MNIQEINKLTQYSFWENVSATNIAEIRTKIKSYFELLDEELFNSNFRKEARYIPKGFVKRTIITIYGAIRFKRRRYIVKNSNNIIIKNIYLLDEKINISSYERVNVHLQLKILTLIADGKRYRDILDIFSEAGISLMTISNIMKKFNLKACLKEYLDNVPKIQLEKYLYINIDETYVTLKADNKNQKYRIRIVTFNTGYDLFLTTNKRKVLANKRAFAILLKMNEKISSGDFVNKINKFANKFYDNYEDAIKIIGGDGAPWIKKTRTLIPNSIFTLDKFHLFRLVRRTLIKKKEKKFYDNFKHATKIINQGNVFVLVNYLEKLKLEPEYQKCSRSFNKCLNYIKNNFEGISSYCLPFVIGCSAESTISLLVKSLLNYGTKVFNFNTYKNMLYISMSKVNGINIKDVISTKFINHYSMKKI